MTGDKMGTTGMGPKPVIGIDAVGISGGGGLEVVRDAVSACLRNRDGIVVLFASDVTLINYFAGQQGVRPVEVRAVRYARRLFWWIVGARRAARMHGCEAMIHMANIGWTTAWNRPAAVFVHQPMVLYRDLSIRYEHRMLAQIWLMKRFIAFSVARADRVFVQSQYVADELGKSFRPSCPVEVVVPKPPESLSPYRGDPTPARSDSARRPIFVYVGSAARHKNLDVIYGAASRLNATSEDMLFRLTVLPIDETARADSGIEHVGPLSRQEVANLFANATALVMPSLAETVGLPMLEAMDFGLPVIAPDKPYAREICGDAAHYFDPYSPNDLIRACKDIARSEALRRELIKRGHARCTELRNQPGLERVAVWAWEAAAGTDPPSPHQ